MMISHHELIARQRIQCVLELIRLRDGEIARVGHTIELALQQRLACRLRQKKEKD